MTMTDLSPLGEPRHVTKIRIRKLFGYLDYDIPLVSQGPGHDDLLIIYGDNGSGKTTI
jgi:predicted ATP-binding protein involved in virulence